MVSNLKNKQHKTKQNRQFHDNIASSVQGRKSLLNFKERYCSYIVLITMYRIYCTSDKVRHYRNMRTVLIIDLTLHIY